MLLFLLFFSFSLVLCKRKKRKMASGKGGAGSGASSHTTCQVPDEIVQTFKKFKARKNPANCAIILKINKAELTVEVEDSLDDVLMDDLLMEMPDTTPRFVIYRFFPFFFFFFFFLCFIFFFFPFLFFLFFVYVLFFVKHQEKCFSFLSFFWV